MRRCAILLLLAAACANASGFYRSVTIDHTKVGGTNTSLYPAFFSGTYAYLATVANGGKVTSSSGYDIIFCTDHTNCLGTKVAFERVAWNAATGYVNFYFLVTTLSHTADTVLYLYYGDSSITTDQQNAAATWDSFFKLVMHFGDGSGVNVTDSTGQNTCSNSGGTVLATPFGGIAGAVRLNSGNFIDCGNGSAVQLVGSGAGFSYTFESTMKYFGAGSGNVPMLAKFDSGETNGYVWYANGSNGVLAYATWASGALYSVTNGVGTALDGSYHLDAGSLDIGTLATTYIDGANQAASGSGSGASGNSSDHLFLGKDSLGEFANIGLTEVRFSNGIQRSADYHLATFNNLSAPSTFYTVGSETPVTGSVQPRRH